MSYRLKIKPRKTKGWYIGNISSNKIIPLERVPYGSSRTPYSKRLYYVPYFSKSLAGTEKYWESVAQRGHIKGLLIKDKGKIKVVYLSPKKLRKSK